MPSERTADKPTTRRHPQEEQAAAVRVARTLHAELGHDHGVVKRVAEQLSCYEAELIPLPHRRCADDSSHTPPPAPQKD